MCCKNYILNLVRITKPSSYWTLVRKSACWLILYTSIKTIFTSWRNIQHKILRIVPCVQIMYTVMCTRYAQFCVHVLCTIACFVHYYVSTCYVHSSMHMFWEQFHVYKLCTQFHVHVLHKGPLVHVLYTIPCSASICFSGQTACPAEWNIQGTSSRDPLQGNACPLCCGAWEEEQLWHQSRDEASLTERRPPCTPAARPLSWSTVACWRLLWSRENMCTLGPVRTRLWQSCGADCVDWLGCHLWSTECCLHARSPSRHACLHRTFPPSCLFLGGCYSNEDRN